MIYDITNLKSVILLWNWIKRVFKRYGDMPIILIGNKTDSRINSQISKKEGEIFAKK